MCYGFFISLFELLKATKLAEGCLQSIDCVNWFVHFDWRLLCPAKGFNKKNKGKPYAQLHTHSQCCLPNSALHLKWFRVVSNKLFSCRFKLEHPQVILRPDIGQPFVGAVASRGLLQ
jgi:hypothetical protein